jgi:NADPH:quinone reductase-like Zn-dependent oxidoreductase
MRAMAVNGWGGGEQLELVDVPVPPVAPDGVLVRVRAAGVNPVDWKVREGRLREAFPFHFPLILGWDLAGEVEKVGPAVTWFRPGDKVYGYGRRHELQWGTYAEYATLPEGYLAHVPTGLSLEDAAALPLAALTAHQGLERLGLRAGEELFVDGGAGGVGHMIVQLAVARGARVIASGSPGNHDFLRELGAEPIDYAEGGVGERVRALSAGGDGVDAAFDLFGGPGRDEAARSMRRGGRLLSLASPPPEKRDDIEVHYVFVRPSGYDLGEHITPLVEDGVLRVHVEETYPLERAAEALERLEAGHVRGKLVLTID